MKKHQNRIDKLNKRWGNGTWDLLGEGDFIPYSESYEAALEEIERGKYTITIKGSYTDGKGEERVDYEACLNWETQHNDEELGTWNLIDLSE